MDKSLLSGERQVAETFAGIRKDHLARYQWAAEHLKHNIDVTNFDSEKHEVLVKAGVSSILDLGCGSGYGCKVLAEAGHSVIGIDDSLEAVEYARQHYSHKGVIHLVRDVAALRSVAKYTAAVCFETVEHLADPAPMLKALRCKRLLVSVPNESVFQFTGQKFHHRHYRKSELEELLNANGWTVQAWYTQDDTKSDVRAGYNGWTLIADAVR